MTPGAPEAETGKSVLIQGGVIRAVGAPSAFSTPDGALVIDGGGRTLLPGLIDAHVHLWDEAELAGYLAHGVTSVRNMSGMPFHLGLKRRIEDGRILGPDFVTTGPILNSPGPNAQANHKLVSTPEEGRAEVRAQHAAGYRVVKVYSNLHRDIYEAILDETRERDMGVVGHTPEGVRGEGRAPRQALRHRLREDPRRRFSDHRAYRVHRLARPARSSGRGGDARPRGEDRGNRRHGRRHPGGPRQSGAGRRDQGRPISRGREPRRSIPSSRCSRRRDRPSGPPRIPPIAKARAPTSI